MQVLTGVIIIDYIKQHVVLIFNCFSWFITMSFILNYVPTFVYGEWKELNGCVKLFYQMDIREL